MKVESLLLPLLLLAATIFIEVVTRTIALSENRGELSAFRDSQETQYKLALDLQKQLEGVAADTARLAQGGNANAVEVMDRLKAAGVSVNLNPAAANAAAKPADPKP